MICSSWGLCFCSRPVRGSVSSTRAGFGCPTLSRALSFTALVAENFPGLRLVMAPACAPLASRSSMDKIAPPGEEPETMEERDFFIETTELRNHNLPCPKCGQAAEYKVTWVVRRKRPQIPRNADERDRARFAKAQSYMVRRDV